MRKRKGANLLTIRVQWHYGIERLIFDPLALPRVGAVIKTTEFWPDDNKTVEYNVEITVSKHRQDGGFRLALKYSKDLNPELAKENIYWGTATYDVPAKLGKAKIQWHCAGKDRSRDGKLIGTILREEEERIFDRESYDRIKRAQKDFRKKICIEGKSCAITGIKTEDVLQAAHVLDVCDGGKDEPENGMLLRADLHLLFDKRLFSIVHTGKNKGKIKTDPCLPDEYAQFLKGKYIDSNVFVRIKENLAKRNSLTRAKHKQDI